VANLNNHLKAMFLAVCAVTLVGCTITQHVKPVENLGASEICIIQDNAVRASFLTVYETALKERGYSTRLLHSGAAINECEVTSTYLGRWSWDLALYLSYAKIAVYHNGEPAGEAVYDSTSGGGNLNKFIDADHKIQELVAQLFPPR